MKLSPYKRKTESSVHILSSVALSSIGFSLWYPQKELLKSQLMQFVSSGSVGTVVDVITDVGLKVESVGRVLAFELVAGVDMVYYTEKETIQVAAVFPLFSPTILLHY